MKFYTNDIVINETGYHLANDKVDIEWDDDWVYLDTDNDIEREKRDRIEELINSFKIEKIIVEKASNKMSSFDYKYLI